MSEHRVQGHRRGTRLATAFVAMLAVGVPAIAQKADIFGEDAVFIIEATSIEEVDTAALPVEAGKQIGRLRTTTVAAQAPPLLLPALDFSGATGELEPNEKPESANPMTASLAVTGTTQKNDIDYFVFQLEGASDALDSAQLWAIEAIGESVREIGYLSAAREKTVQSQVQGTEADDAHRFVLANLLLYPGEHRVWVRGAGDAPADYRLRIVPLGAPDPDVETEPNDTDSRAHALDFGRARSGYLFTPQEQDLYYFNLLTETIVTLRVDPPQDTGATVTLALSGRYSGGEQFLKAALDGSVGAYEQTRRLPPGNYTVRLKASDVSSVNPYRVVLSIADPDTLPVDLEPNDTPEQAVALPADHRVSGMAATRGDYDYFLLPTLAPGTQIRISSEGEVDLRERRRLVVLPREASINAPSLVTYDEAASAWLGTIPDDAAQEQVFVLRVQASQTEYAYQVEFSPGPPATLGGPPAIAVELPRDPLAVAAYLKQSQRLKVPLTVSNAGNAAQVLRIASAADDPRWRVQQSVAELSLAPGEAKTLSLGVTVPADAGDLRPVRISTVFNGAGGRRVETFDVAAICGVPPVDPVSMWSLPASLLGGINVAAGRFGGAAVDGGRAAENLFDDRTPYASAWAPKLDAAQVTVDLAGDQPVQVRGVALNSRTNAAANLRARRFRIETSTDGINFLQRLRGELHAVGEEQAFAFDAPVAATRVRLTIEDTHQVDNKRKVSLGEFKVIAEPDSRPLGGAPFNLADPALGGYVVWSDPQIGRRAGSLLTSEKPDTARRKLDITRPNHWVIGFHHARAAQITALEWVQPVARPNTRQMSEVQVAVGDGPLGPWTSLGTWSLNEAPESTSRLELDEPAWARFVRFTHTQAQDAREWWSDAETLRVFERPANDGYRSILGEWGHYGREAAREFSQPVNAGVDDGAVATSRNGTRADAAPLELERPVTGSVRVAQEEDWYAITIPPDHNRLTLDLSSANALRVRPTLIDDKGQAVALEKTRDGEDGKPLLEAVVEPGGQYQLQLVEPPRSVVFVWDNSASVKPYIAQIYRALARFAQGLTPGREEGNLLALGAGAPLLEPWARHPYELQQFLTNYDRRHSTSASEKGMLAAAKALSEREGTRAVVHIADGLSGSSAQPSALWRSFAEAPVRVFPLELQGGSSKPYQQDVMQSWAEVDGGVYDYFGTADDLEHGFARAACLIRRPADYRLVAATRYEAPPEPGALQVMLDASVPLNAVELILDASGSMWAQIDGKARITIAHDVLDDLVSESIPAGTPLAVRIFGHREARSCRTDLEVPLGPLDPDAVIRRIRAAKPKERSKTPLAASLQAVATDLQRVEGTRIVVLLTDGKETCDGDPAATIEALKEAGIDVRVNIVGFAIDDGELALRFDRWAALGGGRYFDADNEAALASAMQQALQPKFQVLDEQSNTVAEGTAGGESVALDAGTYTVRVLTSPVRMVTGVQIAPSQQRKLSVD